MAINYKGPGFWAGCKKLLNDLKPMTWKQRAEHIGMYYKEHMFIVLLVLMTIIAGVGMAMNAAKDVLISGVMVNIDITQEGRNYLEKDYFEDLGGDPNTQQVNMYSADFSALEDAVYEEDQYSASQVLVGLVTGAKLDYMLLDQFAMEFYIRQDVYFDLRDFFTEEELADLDAAKRVIYAMEEGTTDRVPIAVDISNAEFVKENISAEEKTFFAISGNSPDLKMCRDVYERIYKWQKPAQ